VSKMGFPTAVISIYDWAGEVGLLLGAEFGFMFGWREAR